MYSGNLKNLVLLVSFFILLGSMGGCNQRILFDPDFYVTDHTIPGITNEQGQSLKASDPQFDDFACMSRAKVEELEELLMTHGSPKLKMRARKEYEKLTLRMIYKQIPSDSN